MSDPKATETSVAARTKAAAAAEVVYVLPVAALIVAIVGPDDKTAIVWVLVGSFACLIALFKRGRIAELGRLIASPLTSIRRIEELQRKQAAVIDSLVNVTVISQGELLDTVNTSLAELHAELGPTIDLVLYTAKSSLGARALFFDRMARPVYVIHSHRPEEEIHRDAADDSRPIFTMPPVPADEADFIPMVSQWAMNSKTWVSSAESIPATDDIIVRCACGTKPTDDILRRDLICIGSNIFNVATQTIQNAALARNWLAFTFAVEEHKDRDDPAGEYSSVYIRGVPGSPHGNEIYRPDPENTPPNSGPLIDYALLTRMPNPLSTDDKPSFVVIAGGCLLAGQVALTDWLSKPANLHSLSIEFEERPCQYVLSVNYHYTAPWKPIVDKASIKVVQTTSLSAPVPDLPERFRGLGRNLPH